MQTVQSIDRGMDILEAFTYEKPELGLMEICHIVGLTKGTVYRIVYTLAERGYISKDPISSKYRLGPKAFEIGSVAMSQMEIRRTANPFLVKLSNITGETVHLVIHDRGEVLYLDKVDSPQSIRMNSFTGQRLPMHATGVGKVLLAYMSEEEVKSICNIKSLLRMTSNTIVSYEKLVQDLAVIKQNGYAFDNEESQEGLRCIAAPIRDYSERVIAAISVSIPIMRFGDERVPSLLKNVLEIAAEISYQMGYR
ncbi:MAG: hypothetical protein APF76_18170 [Desulfitibacter sp. BRH_c19]|nr:MAG: hypothetical protein APF76_18170 [Desulfitibacter sp. BRH_c19]